MKQNTLKRTIYAALFGAMAFVVMFVFSIPIIPSAPFLKYEPSGMLILFSLVALGPLYGSMSCLLKDLLYFLVGRGNLFGVTMDLINTLCFAMVAGLLLKKSNGSMKNTLLAYAAGILASTLIMIPTNLVILRLEFGMTPDVVMKMMLPAILPFNIVKGVLNALLYHLIGRTLLRRGHFHFDRLETT